MTNKTDNWLEHSLDESDRLSTQIYLEGIQGRNIISVEILNDLKVESRNLPTEIKPSSYWWKVYRY
ncbi:hypothetical protein WKH57_01170 [Niallia taxi]|uniref:hypothetical protein n=1 Tax=Niallia taxi TaxID=2499688 RepID=UPI003175A992